jgi:opine dehydrogenase
MREDTLLGLSLLVSVADLAGVDAPLARSFLSLGSAICGFDVAREGRTLANLGLNSRDKTSLQKFLEAGFA